jgi:hypothetical protein
LKLIHRKPEEPKGEMHEEGSNSLVTPTRAHPSSIPLSSTVEMMRGSGFIDHFRSPTIKSSFFSKSSPLFRKGRGSFGEDWVPLEVSDDEAENEDDDKEESQERVQDTFDSQSDFILL